MLGKEFSIMGKIIIDGITRPVINEPEFLCKVRLLPHSTEGQDRDLSHVSDKFCQVKSENALLLSVKEQLSPC
jgi:hypothetical protein